MLDADIRKKIMAAVDRAFDEQVAFTQELVSIPSVRGEEAPAQDFMARAMRERGLDVDRWKIDIDAIRHLPGFSPVAVSYDNAYNVVGAHRPDRSEGRSLILNGHIDVVPVGPLERWSRSPYDPEIVDGWMYGRGSGDMKAGLAGCLFALDALKRAGYVPAAELFVQSVVEEECTGNGALACLERGYKADAAFIPEPMEPQLLRAQVGVMWFQVQVEGDPQHASGAFTPGVNAIEKAFELIQALKELETRWNAMKGEIEHYHHHPHPIRFNLGKIQGGDWTSSVPAWCHFDMRIGLYPGWKLEDVRDEVETCIREKARDDSFLANRPPRVVYNGFQAEGYVLRGAEEAESVLAASHEAVFGEALTDIATSATTDARFFGLYADTPALVYGPTCQAPHGFDECVELESVRQTTQTMALFIAEWCGLERI